MPSKCAITQANRTYVFNGSLFTIATYALFGGPWVELIHPILMEYNQLSFNS